MERVWYRKKGEFDLKETQVDANQNTMYVNENEIDSTDLEFDCPISGTVYGTILNYEGEIKMMGEDLYEDPYKKPPEAPVLYIKPKNTFTGHNQAIPLPEDVSEITVGAALGLVIGKTASKLTEEEALEYVSGYTIVNDVSVPHESVYRPAVRQKARDGFCPVGPWILKREDVESPDHLIIQVRINGELRQVNTTENLIRSVERLLVDVTEFMTLYEGDVLLVGVPEKAPIAKAGDEIQIEIDEVGTLQNKVVPENELNKAGDLI